MKLPLSGCRPGRHLTVLILFGACLATTSVMAVQPDKLIEPPAFAAAVESGSLPPLPERLPTDPEVVVVEGEGLAPGRHGGQWRMLMGKAKDTRLMTVYGYGRLVGYNRELELQADILESIEVTDQRVFTLHLRAGHKWSDGAPFTSEDFRYYWEDVANNEELSLYGPPKALEVDGQPPEVEIVDELTIRYSWPGPNPSFLAALAGARPLFIYRPAHYLKQFHVRYVEPEALKAMVSKAGTRNWAGLHHRMDNQYKLDNPDLPVLQPWMLVTRPPSDRFVFKRNPYYHKIDQNGRQLPYIDTVVINIAAKQLIPAKTGAGESDLQARYLRFDNYTFLREGEQRNGYKVRLWDTGKGSQMAVYPNLNVADPGWRALVRDVRFRRALSLAIDRDEINQVVFFGLAVESNDTVTDRSPLFEPGFQSNWVGFDLKQANALLDDIGLTGRNRKGWRLLPDGRPLEIIVETAGESTEETDILELIHDSWLQIGVKVFTKPSQREVFRNRIFSGDTVMSVWSGLDNGIPTARMSPMELAPTNQVQLQWPKWGQYYESDGQTGEPPDLPEVKRLLELNEAWNTATSDQQRAEIWRQMLTIRSEQLYSIGTVTGVPQPVVVSKRLNNVPEKGIFTWEPGSYFGIYQPDTFWFSDAGQ